ncbi:MAG: L-serine ammonia-lyase, iron-sulfur-dependent, subunit alpha [Coriobacteriia bacterium]|nr:L-serine ammonia-lyase, iron-sulfur-dependent, subunit alpha [Coriobacteriia bacterium]MCL2537141.1 L-serine ammonia-lyase, iron-sulfur-dependent, subunit alpha [Coriobacteriia bacterium]
MPYSSFAALLEDAARENMSLAECVQSREAADSDISPGEVRARLAEALEVMKAAIKAGSAPDIKSRTGLTGGDAAQLFKNANDPDAANVVGARFTHILAASIATVELNAAMGRIVAAPTAGASGVLPGVFLSLRHEHELTDDQLIDGLLIAGAIGACFASTATLSGAAGGCQAEIGTAAAMTAAAVAYMLGSPTARCADTTDGDPARLAESIEAFNESVSHAASFAMQGQLGLVCDPVAGLVEVPCIARNATGAAVALAGAQMALAGLKFPIPFDEVVEAASRVGAAIPPSLRETAKGGLAITKTAKQIAKDLQS